MRCDVTVKFILVNRMWSPKRRWMKLCNLIKRLNSESTFRGNTKAIAIATNIIPSLTLTTTTTMNRSNNSQKSMLTIRLDANREFAIICYSNKRTNPFCFTQKYILSTGIKSTRHNATIEQEQDQKKNKFSFEWLKGSYNFNMTVYCMVWCSIWHR